MLKEQPIQVTNSFMFTIDYVLRELLNNAVEHGNKMMKELKVTFKVVLQIEKITIEVWDKGMGFSLEDSVLTKGEEDPLRERSRGLPSIIALGFQLKIIEGGICALYLFDKTQEMKERQVKRMDISLNNRTLMCSMNNSLVSKNIKEMTGELKPYLDNKESYDSFMMDMQEVARIDSMGITFLIGIYKMLMSQNTSMKIYGLAEPILNLFKIMKLDEVFEVQT